MTTGLLMNSIIEDLLGLIIILLFFIIIYMKKTNSTAKEIMQQIKELGN